MIAIHQKRGPRGFAVLQTEDGPVLAANLTREQAILLVRGGEELDDKYKGNSVGAGPIDPVSHRVPRHTYAHNQAQAPWDYL